METSADRTAISSAPWTVEELIEVAERLMAASPRLFAHPDSESGKELNVRLIRDYVVREFIPRPERIGRESRFGREHLIWLLAVRGLLRSQRWSLPAIKASFSSTTSEELLAGLLAPVRPNIEAEFRKATRQMKVTDTAASTEVKTPELNPAQLLIEQFKKHKRPTATEPPMGHLTMAAASKLGSSRNRVFFQRARVEEKTHIEIDPGCEVVIDALRMLTLTPEEVEQLGEALKTRLRNEIAR